MLLLVSPDYFADHMGDYEDVLASLEMLNLSILKAMDYTKRVSAAPCPSVPQLSLSAVKVAHKSDRSPSSSAVLCPPALQTTQPLCPSGEVLDAGLLSASLRGLLETPSYRAAFKSSVHLGRHAAFQTQLLMCEAATLETRVVCLKDCRGIMQAPKPRQNDLVYMCKVALSP